jgi:hypothetical protein
MSMNPSSPNNTTIICGCIIPEKHALEQFTSPGPPRQLEVWVIKFNDQVVMMDMNPYTINRRDDGQIPAVLHPESAFSEQNPANTEADMRTREARSGCIKYV